jgi:hypothetical protein
MESKAFVPRRHFMKKHVLCHALNNVYSPNGSPICSSQTLGPVFEQGSRKASEIDKETVVKIWGSQGSEYDEYHNLGCDIT